MLTNYCCKLRNVVQSFYYMEQSPRPCLPHLKLVDLQLVSSVNPDCMLGISGCATYGTNPPFTNNLLYTVSRPIGNDTKEGSYRIYWSTIGAPTILLTEAPNGASEKSGIIWQAFLEDNTPEVPFLTLWNQRYVAITLMSVGTVRFRLPQHLVPFTAVA